MRRYFITYGDELFNDAKKRIVKEAEQLGLFDNIIAYDNNGVSPLLKKSEIFSIKRGGGLWSWKPDVILQTLYIMDDNDILVYCDAGCKLQLCKEWQWYLNTLNKYHIIAQRIYQRTENWTRRELIDYFKENGSLWPKMFQFQAGIIILKKTAFTVQFVKEWRDLMINNSQLAMDVDSHDMIYQIKSFRENRHDQSIYSALIYKYLRMLNSHDIIYTMWEHVEDKDIFFKQAIRSTRCRTGNIPNVKMEIRACIKRMFKDFIYKPFIIAPQQMWFQYKN